MLTNVIGFAGVECYDIILYIGRTLTGFGKRVLLSDCSESLALKYCIDAPEELKDTIQHYNGMDYVNFIEEVPEDYDYVLINFGKITKEFTADCSEVYLITDYQKHNVAWISECSIPEEVYVGLIYRDRISSKITIDSLLFGLQELGIQREDVSILEDTYTDLESKVLCQYNSSIIFNRVSDSVKKFIIRFCNKEWADKEIAKMIRRVAGGNKK